MSTPTPEAMRAAEAINDFLSVYQLLDDDITEIAEIIDREIGGWRPIEEAPKDQLIDLWTGVDRIPNALWNNNVSAFCGTYGRGQTYRSPTHFRELPTPPNQ